MTKVQKIYKNITPIAGVFSPTMGLSVPDYANLLIINQVFAFPPKDIPTVIYWAIFSISSSAEANVPKTFKSIFEQHRNKYPAMG